MSNKKIQTVDEYLKETFPNKKKEKTNSKQKKKKKGVIIAIVAAVAAGVIALTSGIAAHFSKKKNQDDNTNTASITTLDDMGNQLDFPEEPKPQYGETTGNVDVNKIVEKDGKIYVDQESANKSDKVGTSSVDTKGDTLKVESDGTVKEKTEGYEIVDKETGSIIQSGDVSSDGSIDSFEYDEDLNDTFEEEDNVETLTYADSNYYDEYGNLVLQKGDLVEEERLEYAKKHYSTTEPIASNVVSSNVSSTASSNTSSTSNQGVVNEDGTYTIGGITYLSKADYQQCILDGYEGYAIIGGVMQPMPQQNQIQKIK